MKKCFASFLFTCFVISTFFGVGINSTFALSNYFFNDPSCTSGYKSWPQSSTRKTDAAWDISFIAESPSGEGKNEQFLDINGDGLLDYLYTYQYYYESVSNPISWTRNHTSCLYLNTGTGWNKAFRCIFKLSGTTNPSTNVTTFSSQIYYGDCAQI